jgi:hypothetical protein
VVAVHGIREHTELSNRMVGGRAATALGLEGSLKRRLKRTLKPSVGVRSSPLC